jgi:hypothetical protein
MDKKKLNFSLQVNPFSFLPVYHSDTTSHRHTGNSTSFQEKEVVLRRFSSVQVGKQRREK